MSHLVGSPQPVQKVTIVSRGRALGYTLNTPQEDRYLHTKEELLDLMKVLLSGRAAEQIVFGTWDLDNFFGIDGNGAYVIGWSLADGTYPILTLYGLRLAARWIPGLIAI